MDYNNIIFGEKMPIFMNSQHTNQGYYIASANNTLSAAYKSGAFNINEDFPEDLYYWEIGEDSPYNGLSFAFRTGTSPNYTWVPFLYRNKERVPLYCVAGRGRLDADFNITPTGTMHNNYDANDVFVLQQNRFQISDTNYPLWYYNRTVSGTANPNGLFDPAPFIVDFDYNNVILIIYINGSMSLDEFIRNRNNGTKITEISYVMYAGTEDSHITANNIDYPVKTRTSLFTQNYNSDGVNILTGGNGYSGGSIRINHRFPTPDFILDRNYYNLPEFSRIGAMGGNTGRTILFQNSISTSVTPTSITSPSFYRDLDKWGFDTSGWYLKQSGENIYTEDDFNYIRKLISWLGFWFTDGGAYTDSETGVTLQRFNSLLGEDANRYPDSVIPTKIFQSEIKDGVTTGNFTELRIAKDNEQSKWGTDWREKNGYDGRSSIKPSDESSRSSKLTYSSSLASFGNIWLMNNSGISNLANALKTLVTDEQNPYDPTLFYGQNPVDCIIAIKEFPIDISSCIDIIKNPEPVSLGRWNNITYIDEGIGVRLAAPLVTVKSASSPFSYITISIPAYYKNLGYPFMDYEPYSSYHLYLPFCGTVKIPSELAIESRIEVLYYADVLSGACIAHVYINYKYY